MVLLSGSMILFSTSMVSLSRSTVLLSRPMVLLSRSMVSVFKSMRKAYVFKYIKTVNIIMVRTYYHEKSDWRGSIIMMLILSWRGGISPPSASPLLSWG